MTPVNSSAPRGRKALASFWHDFEWPVVGGLALLALALGAFGYYAQFKAGGEARTLWDILYFDIQLFLTVCGELTSPRLRGQVGSRKRSG